MIFIFGFLHSSPKISNGQSLTKLGKMRLKISAIGFKENSLPDPVLCVVLKCKFKVDEFLTAGQIQSFFSRTAARLRHAVAPEDDDEEMDDNSRAAEEEEAFLNACNTILVQCAPVHPIV